MKLKLTYKSFEWDEGNRGKNLKHNVTDKETEETFFDPKARFKKAKRERYALFGRTEEGRYLFVIFELKGKSLTGDYDIVRVISAREMTKAHKKFYKEKGG